MKHGTRESNLRYVNRGICNDCYGVLIIAQSNDRNAGRWVLCLSLRFSFAAKMKHLWPFVAWIILSSCPVRVIPETFVSFLFFFFRWEVNTNDLSQAESQKGFSRGPKTDVFFLNLEDGYFGCQVNESTDVLQLLELSKLCDDHVDCFRGTDENRAKLKCTSIYFDDE